MRGTVRIIADDPASGEAEPRTGVVESLRQCSDVTEAARRASESRICFPEGTLYVQVHWPTGRQPPSPDTRRPAEA